MSLKGGVMNPIRKAERVLRRRETELRGSCGCRGAMGDERGEGWLWRDERRRWAMSRKETRRGRSLEDCGCAWLELRRRRGSTGSESRQIQ